MDKIVVKDATKIFGHSPDRGLRLLEDGKTKEEILAETGLTVGVYKANFSVKAGEIFVIMGLSGSGKSTLVRMLNRLIEPTAGEILLDGEDVTGMNAEALRNMRRTKMSMVFQRFALFPHRTVQQNVGYGLEIQGMDKNERADKVQKSLELVGLGDYADSYPDQLSGGMQQRVGLARALANDPDILLMDEAFSALDPLIRKDMQDELVELQSEMQKTIVFITHDLDEALRIGDRIALMKDGVIVQVGTPEDILTNPANDYVERFVEDVDWAKVFSAANVMKRAEKVTLDKDGPRVALNRMRDKGLSSLFAVDRKNRLHGLLTADGAKLAIEEGKSLVDVIERDIVRVKGDTLLSDIVLQMAETPYPVAVVTDDDRLRGVIVRGSVIGALAGKEVGERV
ncbi:quaternary amine ABC transporter ATP-binding protein [Novibacillus thermophilus]|jgi:glycine betaine/proline transport system ATP-binding protein|uniref:Quaternary amine transport ATP-binding protein n=1 Tax=Novibacillus thermophilus TaxID=1471761 RepID=A0A1U9K4N4_9BACL|nr:glycine betaine/L-proline ABC transporter ATP-binding protein [Novibacillus thermophilus]AQS54992.1 glycine betaine/L-proline ABC transporter ATP-binding protein [Novibacillus thermophilus]